MMKAYIDDVSHYSHIIDQGKKILSMLFSHGKSYLSNVGYNSNSSRVELNDICNHQRKNSKPGILMNILRAYEYGHEYIQSLN